MMLLADLEILARTVWGEARGETYDGKKAVAHVMLNRWRSERGQFAKDDTIATACLRHVQFSTWNKGDANFDKMQMIGLDDLMFRACMRACLEAFDEEDFTEGSTHYHTRAVNPDWALGHTPTLQLGSHIFYNDVA